MGVGRVVEFRCGCGGVIRVNHWRPEFVASLFGLQVHVPNLKCRKTPSNEATPSVSEAVAATEVTSVNT